MFIVLCITLLFVGCSKEETNNNNEIQESISEELNQVVTPEYWFEEVREEYENGTKSLSYDEINKEELEELYELLYGALSEYTEFFDDMNVESEVASLGEIEGYNDAVLKIYEVFYSVYYFDDEKVLDECEEAWGYLQEGSLTGVTVLSESYDLGLVEESEIIITMIEDVVYDLEMAKLLTESIVSYEKMLVGETFIQENVCEITINEIDYTQRVNPSETTTLYRYYEVDNDEAIFLACNFDLVSLHKEVEYDLDEFVEFSVEYESGYSFSGWCVGEEGGSLSAYPSILPLTTLNSWCIIEVPISLQETEYELTVVIDGVHYIIE